MKVERGMVTLELALVSILVAGAIGVAAWLIGQVLVFDQCQLTAHEVARQAARGDSAAVARASADRPAGTSISISDAAGATSVVVRFQPTFAGVSVADLSATATVLDEARA